MTHITTPGTALITGASAGIGATYADRLAKRGHDLVLVARDGQRLEEVAARLRGQYGRTVEAVRADLTLPDDVKWLEHRVADDPAITLLLNNAGMAVEGGFASCDIDKVQAMIALNVVAPTRLAKAAAQRMEQSGAGTIINIGSVTSLLPEFFSGAYSGTKAYMFNLSVALHAELAEKGVRVQLVLPGATRTELWERAGIDVHAFPPEMVMTVDALVDAALSGLDQGEVVTIPSLDDMRLWGACTGARLALRPYLSLRQSAARYRTQ